MHLDAVVCNERNYEQCNDYIVAAPFVFPTSPNCHGFSISFGISVSLLLRVSSATFKSLRIVVCIRTCVFLPLCLFVSETIFSVFYSLVNSETFKLIHNIIVLLAFFRVVTRLLYSDRPLFERKSHHRSIKIIYSSLYLIRFLPFSCTCYFVFSLMSVFLSLIFSFLVCTLFGFH